jgi:hypothetical protein
LAELAGMRTRNALIAIYRATALLEIFNASTTNVNTKGAAGVETVVITLANAVASAPTSYYLQEFSAIAGSTPRSIHMVAFTATYGGEESLWTVVAGVKYYDPDFDPEAPVTTTITVKGYYKL